MTNDIESLEHTLDGQTDEEVVEIESDGTVKPAGAARTKQGKKSILHDPQGEYGVRG